MNMIADVREFHEKFGQPVLGRPEFPSRERMDLRWRLIQEEYFELAGGISKKDLPEVADAIADLIYVLIGTAHEFGIPLGHVWNAVHQSNVAKVGGGADAKGKIMKPEGWVAPDIEGILRQHGWVK